MAATKRRWWSLFLLVGADLAITLLLAGALGTKFGLWDFQLGFTLLFAGAIIAAITLVLAIAGWVVANKRGYTADKGFLIGSVVLSALVLGFLGLQFAKASSVPPIHNISTDVDNPPQFNKVVALRGDDSNPLAYNREELAEKQLAAYPKVRSKRLPVPPAQAITQAENVLEAMGLEIVASDPDNGIVEATATTFWFGFKDDVVVRALPADSGSVVDVRSVSRVGQSDLGANAARIRAILEQLDADGA